MSYFNRAIDGQLILPPADRKTPDEPSLNQENRETDPKGETEQTHSSYPPMPLYLCHKKVRALEIDTVYDFDEDSVTVVFLNRRM